MSCLMFLFILAISFPVITTRNLYLPWDKDSEPSQNCICYNNNGIIYIDNTEDNNQISIYPIANGSDSCTNSICLNCFWKVNVTYSNPLDVIEVQYGQIPKPDTCVYSFIVSDCNNTSILNVGSLTTDFDPLDRFNGFISIVTNLTEICVYFNSSNRGNTCNYDSCNTGQIVLNYQNVSNCGCGPSQGSYNINNTSSYLPIGPAFDYYCLNVPCHDCQWNITYNTSYALHVSFGQSFHGCDSELLITDCKSSKSLISGSSITELQTQEDEICITFKTNNADSKCSYYPTISDYCYFYVSLSLDLFDSTYIINLIINPNLPILLLINFEYSDPCYDEKSYRITSSFGTLQLWVANNPTLKNPYGSMYIYDAPNFTNIIASYDYNEQFETITSASGSLTLLTDDPSVISSSSSLDLNHLQFIFRVVESRFSNCYDTNYVNYAYPFHEAYNLTMSSNSSGNCLVSILSPVILEYDSIAHKNYVTPSPLYITNLTYKGPSVVTVILSIYNETYGLFEFSETNSQYWNNFLIYGNLINFIIPPDGTLKIEYESWQSGKNISEYYFEDYGTGIVQTNNYPISLSNIYYVHTIKCSKGVAKITITLVFAEIPADSYLQIVGQDQTKSYSSGIFNNTKMDFHTDTIVIDYNIGASPTATRGFLLLYEGSYIDIVVHKPISEEAWFWVIVCVSILTFVVMIALLIRFYYKRIIKNEKRRVDFMFSFIKRQNKLSNEAVKELRETSDALLIDREKLLIHYNRSLGTGICSMVYRGFLSGIAPLTKISNLIETQKFQDCEVAVKLALNFNDDEIEQLFREIYAMKTLEYNRNVIALLGWRMMDDKPALVFEMADQDLLKYVKGLRSMRREEIQFKVILMIIWQIAKGMEYVASKGIVHRDLAARNVLLTNTLQAKISDFGLAIKRDVTETTQPNRLPIRWLSIEAMSKKLFTEKSDVWAFGIILFEIFSLGEDPYTGIQTKDLLWLLRNGERMARPGLATMEMYEIMRSCWEENVETRPKFEVLAAKLYDLLEYESGYAQYYEKLEFLDESNRDSSTVNDPEKSIESNNLEVSPEDDQGIL